MNDYDKELFAEKIVEINNLKKVIDDLLECLEIVMNNDGRKLNDMDYDLIEDTYSKYYNL